MNESEKIIQMYLFKVLHY